MNEGSWNEGVSPEIDADLVVEEDLEHKTEKEADADWLRDGENDEGEATSEKAVVNWVDFHMLLIRELGEIGGWDAGAVDGYFWGCIQKAPLEVLDVVDGSKNCFHCFVILPIIIWVKPKIINKKTKNFNRSQLI